jgi:tetratricopeptide (TPR) repeat protein
VKWQVLIPLVVAACAGGADHERLGDVSYGKSLYSEALAEYRTAALSAPSARLSAKVGLSALHTQSYREAAEAYRRLAKEDGSRGFEAMVGLGLVARGAQRANDPVALRDAVVGLRPLAPNRLSGRDALGLVRGGQLSPGEAVLVFPAALAAAPDAGTIDSLLTAYGSALRATTACEDAVRAYRSVRRRSHDAKLRAAAGDGLAECGFQLAREALTLKQPDVAARWYGEAAAASPLSLVGRRARIGLGDLQVEQGDFVAAAIAYQSAITRDTTDSISQLAIQRLNALGSAQGPVGQQPEKQP